MSRKLSFGVPVVPVVLVVLVVLGILLGAGVPVSVFAARDLPTRLSDEEFWALAVDASEPNGYFRSDNLTSNELRFQRIIPELVARTRPGGAYLGVGPEQNFSYIAAVRPAISIIFDIRRGNMLVQLMYKALFEMAADRADFVSLLFSRPRPKGLDTGTSVAGIFTAFAKVPGSEAAYEQNARAIEHHLTIVHHLPLSDADLRGIRYAYRAFFTSGFFVRPSPSYADLMTAFDGTGGQRSYLASEEAFRFLKDLELRNLLIPVVGDFGGPKAIRAVGAYLTDHRATVSAFYLSNVEQYLSPDRQWMAFCRSVATLPLDQTSTFIRSTSAGGFGSGGPRFESSLGLMVEEVKRCAD